jgi:uncharacterized DUF497 family protein
MKFEWDDRKAAINLKKHGVSFEEAATVFENPMRIDHDDFHSAKEDRFIAIGLSNRGRRLFVGHTYRNGNIRIITARLISRSEWDHYVQANS